jgi:hypothetical protein
LVRRVGDELELLAEAAILDEAEKGANIGAATQLGEEVVGDVQGLCAQMGKDVLEELMMGVGVGFGVGVVV